MNLLKKLLAVLTSFVMLMGICSTALAEGEKYQLVIKKTVESEQQDEYEYLLYEMFIGDVALVNGEYVLSNIKWGKSVPTATQNKIYTELHLEAKDQDAEHVAKWVKDNGTAAFHKLQAIVGTEDGTSLDSPTKMVYGQYTVGEETVYGFGVTGLVPGYYLVRNTKVPSEETYSDYIVQVVGKDILAEPKSAVPSSDKKTEEKNDSSNSLISSQNIADYDIGDTIPFTLTATLPENYANYGAYHLVFVDDICSGLTWDGSATIYYGASDTQGASIQFTNVTNQVVPGSSETGVSSYANGTVWAYNIENLKTTKPELKKGDVITIRYNSVLNSSAEITYDGNRNKYHINYSNNPTVQNQMGSTPDTVNIIFTYKAVFNKKDEQNNTLTGADFRLDKFIAGDSGTDKTSAYGTEISGTWVDVTKLNSGTGALNPSKSGSSSGSTFIFSGLDAGLYRLTEITTPTGYNTMDPIEFKITAEHAIDGTHVLTSLKGEGDGITFTTVLSNAAVSADIENKKGIVLPTTGGIGTTLFYAIGGALVAAAGVLLIAKQRMK